MSKGANVKELIKTAQQGGILSKASAQSLIVTDIGEQIQAALGMPADQMQASEVVLVTMMMDDSGSIRFASNSQAVRDGHNLVIEALLASKQNKNILAHTRYLNGFVLYPYSLLSQTVQMDARNYDPDKGTPLYDQTMVVLGTVLAKQQEFVENGVPVRAVTLLVTDGHDECSVRNNAKDCANLIKDMLMQETHIIAAMGIDDGATDFHEVFKDMGIRDEWILTPDKTQSEIRRAFRVFSQSAVRASQSAKTFSQTALGGFGAN